MNIVKGIFILSVLYVLSACSPISKSIKTDNILGDTDGLEKVTATKGKSLVYIRPGFNIGKYSKFKIDPVRTIVTSKTMMDVSAKDKRKMESYLRMAVSKELEESGYQVVEAKGPDIVGIQFILTDMDPSNPYLSVLQFHPVGFSVDTGGVTIQSNFYDTSNNQLNAIAIVGADGARKFNISSVLGQWGDVKKIFDNWAKGFRKKVDKERIALKKR